METALAVLTRCLLETSPSFRMPSVDLTLGPMLIGTFMNMILYGILIVQTLFYIQTYKKDTTWIKYLVIYLFIAETVNTGCDIAMMYQPVILEFGTCGLFSLFDHCLTAKGQPPMNFPIMFASEPILIVAISTPIQLFFAWRIRKLTKMIILPCFICLLALVSLGGGTWTTVKLVVIKLFSRKPELHEPALIWFISSCIADVLITAVLVFSLSKRKTGFASTDDAISKIIRMTVQTGLLTSLFAIGDVVFFMTLPVSGFCPPGGPDFISRVILAYRSVCFRTFYDYFDTNNMPYCSNFLWDLALSKLYTNCLLSTLNARANLNNTTSLSRGQQVLSSETATFGRKPNDGFLDLGHAEVRPFSDNVSDIDKPQQAGSTSSYFELNETQSPQKTVFDATSSFSRQDVEYGITVTKVIETDPPQQGYIGYAH
ncbi:hypothetical protein JOM56_011756 [Amanita muscaria]